MSGEGAAWPGAGHAPAAHHVRVGEVEAQVRQLRHTGGPLPAWPGQAAPATPPSLGLHIERAKYGPVPPATLAKVQPTLPLTPMTRLGPASQLSGRHDIADCPLRLSTPLSTRWGLALCNSASKWNPVYRGHNTLSRFAKFPRAGGPTDADQYPGTRLILQGNLRSSAALGLGSRLRAELRIGICRHRHQLSRRRHAHPPHARPSGTSPQGNISAEATAQSLGAVQPRQCGLQPDRCSTARPPTIDSRLSRDIHNVYPRTFR